MSKASISDTIAQKARVRERCIKKLPSGVKLVICSKLLEKVVSKRLDEQVNNFNLHDGFQSAYRPCHSTETALLKVQNDLAEALDQGSTAVLIMLDLSAAFDTIDHDILLQRLHGSFGITAGALEWVRSYLYERQHCMLVGG